MLSQECSTICSIETWTLTQIDKIRFEAFKIWIWRRMEKINCPDKVTNEEVQRRVNEDSQIPKY